MALTRVPVPSSPAQRLPASGRGRSDVPAAPGGRRQRLAAVARWVMLWSVLAAMFWPPVARAADPLAGVERAVSPPPPVRQTSLPPAEELARRYAPIVYLKAQRYPCDPDGEAYVPAPVEVVFDDEFVALRQGPTKLEAARDLAAGDLFRRDGSYFIDLPGRSRVTGCSYELHFNQQMRDKLPVVYAHIAREPGRPGLALQYWFFYYYNDFNDKHEGDWEMIQLLFDDADTVMEALLRGPSRIAYAQHAGGEPAAWTETRVDKENGRPVVYVASGSHANFYGPGIWLGWGNNGAGLGCDITTGPWRRIDPAVRLVPHEVDDDASPWAWLTFAGRWGERDAWVYNGPRGPQVSFAWSRPFTWQEQLRPGSVLLQNPATLGPDPTGLFCPLAEGASLLLTLAAPYPWLVGGGAALGVAMLAFLLVVAWPAVAAAWQCYRRQWPVFARIGGVLVPFSVLANGFMYVLNRDSRLSLLLGLDADHTVVNTAINVLLGAQQLGLLLLITPAVIAVVGDLHHGKRPSARQAYRLAWARLPAVALTHLLATGVMLLFLVSVVGAPLALLWSVRWTFAIQEVVLNGWRGRWALRASAAAVRGRWWRTLVTSLVLFIFGVGLGPLVGLLVLVIFNVPQDLTNALSSVIFAIFYPFAAIGLTQYYLTGGLRAPARRPRLRLPAVTGLATRRASPAIPAAPAGVPAPASPREPQPAGTTAPIVSGPGTSAPPPQRSRLPGEA